MTATLEAYSLTCRNCSWQQEHIVTATYATTLRIQHEFRYDGHKVDVAGVES